MALHTGHAVTVESTQDKYLKNDLSGTFVRVCLTQKRNAWYFAWT